MISNPEPQAKALSEKPTSNMTTKPSLHLSVNKLHGKATNHQGGKCKHEKELIEADDNEEIVARYTQTVRLPTVNKFNILDSVADPSSLRRERHT